MSGLWFRPLGPALGVEAGGIDLSQPLSGRDFERLHDAWIEAGLLLVRRQSLSPPAQIAFTARFGATVSYIRSENAHPDWPEVLVLSNLRRGGRPLGAAVSGRYWHTDGHYMRIPPSASILHAVHVPRVGGDTHFANMAAAYDDLPAGLRARIADLRVVISRVRSRPYNYPEKPPVTDEQRAAWPDIDQPLVRTHPLTGRRALYVGGNVPWRILGMAESESTPLVTLLQQHAVAPRYVHVHRWRRGDLLVWDNRSLIHRATAYEGKYARRHLHRTTVAGELPR